MSARPMTGQRGGPVAAAPPAGGMATRGPVAALAPKGGFAPNNLPAGMRPPTNAGGRPGSSAGVPAGMRPPTSGGMQNAGAGGGVGVPLDTDVQVAVRPVTGMSSGLNGMPTARKGDGRKIADKSYFLTELSRKLNDITRELEAMRTEMERTGHDNQLYAQLERRYEGHMKEVRVLEGQLADFNLAFDKLRTNTNVGEIHEMHAHLRQRNEHEKRAVDEVFLKVAAQEKQTRDIEERIAGLHSAAAARIASLGEEKQSEYLELQDELAGLNERIAEREGLLDHLEHQVAQHEDTLKSEGYQIYSRASALVKENQALAKQKQELEEELSSALSPQEVQAKLTQRIKESSAETADLEKQIQKLEGSIEKLGDSTRAKESELADAKKHSTKAKKYEAIYERDAKMQEFIQTFPAVRQAEQESKRKLKETVVALLKHISKGLNSQASLQAGGSAAPDSAKFNELKSELTFKEEKMADSKKTLATLQAELDKRKEELEKIDQLDLKIGSEITQLQTRIGEMNKEMDEFKTEDELKQLSVQAKKDLLVENARSKKQRDAIKTQVALVSSDSERRSKDLQSSEGFKRIEAWESKLRTHAGAVFTLQEYIQSRKRESDYEGILKECSDITKQINEHLIQQQK